MLLESTLTKIFFNIWNNAYVNIAAVYIHLKLLIVNITNFNTSPQFLSCTIVFIFLQTLKNLRRISQNYFRDSVSDDPGFLIAILESL